MNKTVDAVSLMAGMAAFFAVIFLRFSEISFLTVTDVVIKAVLAFASVSILCKMILGKIMRKIMDLKKKEALEDYRKKQMQKKEAMKKE